jgi:purine-binding chemotaxis protein CheW
LLDIELLLDVQKKNGEKNNIIILNVKDELVGIAVESVSEVMEVKEDQLENITDENNKAYVKAIVNLGSKIVTLIDIDELQIN